MSIADKYRPQFTYDEYCLWELIDGMPYASSPSPIRSFEFTLDNDCRMVVDFKDAFA